MAYITKEQFKKFLDTMPEGTNPEDVVNSFIKQGHQLEGLNDTPETQSTFKDVAVGFAKSAGRTALDLAKVAPFISPATAGMAVSYGLNKPINKLAKPLEEKLQPTNQAQKIGGYIETGAELAFPVGLAAKGIKALRAPSIAEKALTMGEKELARISEGKFKKIFGIEKKELENVGGIIKSEVKKMPDKVRTLANEFKDFLQGPPTQNLKEIKKLKSTLWNETLKLFEGSNKTLNEKQIRLAIKTEIEKKMSFDSPFQKKEILDKTIEPFMDKIKKGTLKDLEEARGKLSQSSRDVSGKLKPAYEALHDAVKNYLKDQLPKEKRAIYDLLKQKHAKAFEIQEILKAKNIASGTSLLKKGVRAAIGAGIIGGAVAGAKKIFK